MPANTADLLRWTDRKEVANNKFSARSQAKEPARSSVDKACSIEIRKRIETTMMTPIRREMTWSAQFCVAVCGSAMPCRVERVVRVNANLCR